MKYFNHSFAATVCVCAVAFAAMQQSVRAQFTPQFSTQNSPAYEAEADKLRSAPPREYDFSKAMLSDVLRFLADDAGISFFGLPEGSENADRLVTFSLRTSPFTALETLSKANGISLIHDNGLWYLRPADDSELIGRVYQINYNSQELVSKSSSSAGTGGANSSSSSGQGSAGGISLQGAPNTFEIKPSKLIEDIKEILNLPTANGYANIAPSISVDSFGQLSAANLSARQSLVAPVGGDVEGSPGDAVNSADPVARVIWNSDSNSLYVVASRQQHQWIEGYLASADQKMSMIAIEVKFFESNKDPSSELGLDWTGTLAGGYGANLSLPESDINLNRIKDYTIPSTAVLSYDDVNVRLRALVDDRNTRTVSYPRMVTLENREVVFRTVQNEPVLSSSSNTSLGAGATSTTAVDYLPIGTVINILPKRMANEKIQLNISVEISKIIGEKFINGNPFPIATSRVYNAPVQVDSGFTVAISGLDEAEDTTTETGVPFLRKIPILGYAFKSRGEENGRKHLMMFITPTVIDSNDPGVPEYPATRTAGDPDVGPAIDEFEPTLMQYAEAHRPVPPRSRRTDFPDASDHRRNAPTPDGGSIMPAPAAPTIDSPSDNSYSVGERTLILAAPSRNDQPTAIVAKADAAPAQAPVRAATPAPAPTRSSAPATGIAWDGDNLKGGSKAIDGAVNSLQAEINDLNNNVDLSKPSLRNESRIATVQKDSQRLIDYVESQKNQNPNAYEELSKAYWGLLKINDQSKRLRQSTIDASGVAAIDPALSTEE